MTEQELLERAKAAGFAAGVIPTGAIRFEPEFRKYCAENLCGNFGVNWSCPPDCGTPEQMKARLLAQGTALVLRSDHNITDYRDRAAILKAKKAHNRAALQLADALRAAGLPGLLIGGGNCDLCDTCARAEGKPCVEPERMFSCLSAYCVHVRDLADTAGLEFASEPGKMSLFGLYAFARAE